jgi:erythromycin esterase
MAPDGADRDLTATIRRRAIPLATVEAGHGFGDLEPVIDLIGAARIVALGEATHGTREFFQLKHRLVEYLVAECGFTTFAIEANWPECEAIDAYVREGTGDPAAALAGLRFWTWDTEEVLDLIEWMRGWNSSRAPDRQVRFSGIDAQFPPLAAAKLREFFMRVDGDWLASILSALADIAGLDPWGERDGDALERSRSDLIGAIGRRLADHAEAYIARSSLERWRIAADHARILHQVTALRQAGDGADGFTVRDRAMADNVDHLLERDGPDSKVIVWAHNGHVTRDSQGMFDPHLETMGQTLAARHGEAYLAVGLLFGKGSFQALVEDESGAWSLREVKVGPPPPGSLDEMLLALAQSPAFLLDTRRQPDPLTGWLSRAHASRDVGAVFTTEADMRLEFVPADRYDVLAFVPRTTRARPTTTGQRTHFS